MQNIDKYSLEIPESERATLAVLGIEPIREVESNAFRVNGHIIPHSIDDDGTFWFKLTALTMAICDCNLRLAQHKITTLKRSMDESGNSVQKLCTPILDLSQVRRFGNADSTALQINDLIKFASIISPVVKSRLAQIGTGHLVSQAGGDVDRAEKLVEEAVAARKEQERLAVEDPTNPMRAFGIEVEIGHGDSTLEGGERYMETRHDEKEANKDATAVRRDAGLPLRVSMTAQQTFNSTLLDFKTSMTCSDWLKNNKLPSRTPLSHFMNPLQLHCKAKLHNEWAGTLDSKQKPREATRNATDVTDRYLPAMQTLGAIGYDGRNYHQEAMQRRQETENRIEARVEKRAKKRLKKLEDEKALQEQTLTTQAEEIARLRAQLEGRSA